MGGSHNTQIVNLSEGGACPRRTCPSSSATATPGSNHPDGLWYGPVYPGDDEQLVFLELEGKLGHASVRRGEDSLFPALPPGGGDLLTRWGLAGVLLWGAALMLPPALQTCVTREHTLLNRWETRCSDGTTAISRFNDILGTWETTITSPPPVSPLLPPWRHDRR